MRLKWHIHKIRPCVSEPYKIIVSAKILDENKDEPLNLVDDSLLCKLIEYGKDTFKNIRCSKALGIIKAAINDANLSFFVEGTLKIQRVANEEEALKIIKIFSKLLLASMICLKCGNSVALCLSSKCACNFECILTYYPLVYHDSDNIERELMSFKRCEFYRYLTSLNQKDSWVRLYQILKDSINYLSEIVNSDSFSSDLENSFFELLKTGESNVVFSLIKGTSILEIYVSLILLGLYERVWKIGRLFIDALKDTENRRQISLTLKYILEVINNFFAFLESECKQVIQLEKSLKKVTSAHVLVDRIAREVDSMLSFIEV
ncbi:MAG: hypothetical protein ACTSSJ_02535 [Candidatus Odinarchaeia archaeon]